MINIVKIYNGELVNQGSNSFEWVNKDYTKLKSVFCSPGVNLALAFENGRKIMFRALEQRESVGIEPNKRVFELEKELQKEIISGVVSRTEPTSSNEASIYLILEK